MIFRFSQLIHYLVCKIVNVQDKKLQRSQCVSSSDKDVILFNSSRMKDNYCVAIYTLEDLTAYFTDI